MAHNDELIDYSALRETFRTESKESLKQLEEAALALEDRPSDPELVQTMFRAAHTVKGNARVVGADSVAEFTHDLEDVFVALRESRITPSRELTTLVLKAVDALRVMVERVTAGAAPSGPGDESLRREFQAMVGATPSAEVSPVQAAPAVADAPSGPAELLQRKAGHSATVRVPVERLDQLMDLVGEIAVARGRLTDMIESEAGHGRTGLLESHHEADRSYMELQELVMKMRMVPLGPLFREYHRAVRDLSVACGNSVRLSLSGEDVEVDTSVVEHLRDPLTHLVRNAASHGIEPWSQRVSAGKSPQGEIAIRASREAGGIVIEVSDDGAGLDRAKILARARRKNVIPAGAEPPEEEIHKLVFEPGFSTMDEVTEIAGRGVGLDVVRRNVEQLRGTIGIKSQPGHGTTVTLRFPLTLSIIEGFRIGVGLETYVVALESVVECIELPPWDRVPTRPLGVTQLRGKPLPFLNLRVLFDLGSDPPDREHVVVVRHGDIEAGLVGDRLLGEAQVVIKPVGLLFQGIPGLAGTAILGNGRVAFVLDVPALLKQAIRLQSELSESVSAGVA